MQKDRELRQRVIERANVPQVDGVLVKHVGHHVEAGAALRPRVHEGGMTPLSQRIHPFERFLVCRDPRR